MKSKNKKEQKDKKKKTTKEIISEVRNEFKDEESKCQILGNPGADYIKTKLPKNFYEDIIIGEMSLEYDFSIDKLTKLMDLYSLGIQYFLENNPVQAKSFQDRMGFILTNKDTLSNLKRQQDQEQREKEEKEKSKTEKKEENNKKELFPKSAKNLPKTNMRKRARTNFMMKSQNIKEEEIHRRVTFVIKSDKIKDKEDVKNMINEDINKQNLKWKEKLKIKKDKINSTFGFVTRPRHRTFFIKAKKFQTPGPIQGRGEMVLKSPNYQKSPNERNFKSKKENANNKTSNNNVFSKFEDLESSEGNLEEKNEGDIEFLKNFKEKHNWKDEENTKEKNGDKKKDDEKKDEEEEDSDSDSDSDSSGTLNSDEFLKKIDEVDDEEEDKRKESISGRKKSQKIVKGNKVSEFNIEETNDNDGKKKEENIIKEKDKDKDKEDTNEISISTQTTEIKNEKQALKRKVSIVEEVNLLRNIDPEEEIVKKIEETMKSLGNLDNINNIINKEEETNDGFNDDISSISNNNNVNPIQDLKLTIDEIPLKFQDTYNEVEEKMKKYVKDLNDHFYKDTFELFSLELKEIYDKKYNKYVEVNNEYHNNIKEKEYQLENDENINEEKKVEIQQIIDSLKEEQKDQIDKITDEYNELIDKKIVEFKQTFFKKDIGINLMEEQLKLEIYTMINEAFY